MELAKKESEDRKGPFEKRKSWTTLDIRSFAYLGSLHCLSLLAPFYFSWDAFWVALVLYVVTGLLGLSISYHRYLSHKSFKLPKWLEYTFAYCGALAFQGDPIDWVSTHRYHHQFADTERDPHSPNGGLLFSHINWIFDSYTLTKKTIPQNVKEIPTLEHNILQNVVGGYLKYGKSNNVADLEKQAFYRFLSNTYILHPIASGVILYAVGGLPYLVWGLGVRIVATLHFTFIINSIGHSWGKQKWRTNDSSKNVWWMSLITYGDSWHNNHHAFEYSARHGFEWWQLDIAWCVILFLEAIGLATDVKLPSEMHKQKLALNKENEAF